jgi:hypothetical protein
MVLPLLSLNFIIMKKSNLNPYDLNRTEYAELLGITPNAVRMRLRHGKLEGEYKFENGKYLFRAPEAVRANIGLTTGQKTTLKKIYRRGNHYKAHYPNEAFRKHNEMKMLAKLKYSVDGEVQALMPEAVEIAKQKKAERMRELQNDLMRGRSPLTNYGTFFNESSRGYGSPGYHSARADIMQPDKFRNRQRVEFKPKKGPYEI